jgi:NADPH:quinone reductase-like Zn-dependent oxidoreductase
MKAIEIQAPAGFDRLVLTERPDPGQPGPGEIRVRILASSLNYHDLAVVAGFMKTADGRIPMSDGAGVVEAIGEGVTEFKAGDSVISVFFPPWQDGPPNIGDFSRTPGDGIDGYARQFAVAPATWFTHAPRGYSHAEAATIPTAGLTAWRALAVEGRLKAGETVLVLGTGGVSIFALQLAKAMGATVIATSSSDEKLERAKALGADHVINYRAEPEWGARAHALAGGRGVDQVIEVGGCGTLPESMKAVALGGHIHMIGVLTGFAGNVPTAFLMTRHARIQGLLVGSRRHQIELVRALDATGIRPVIHRRFPLGEIADAFRFQQAGGHVGKISLDLE